MALKTFKPYTKSTRTTVLVDRKNIWKGSPFKKLTKGISKNELSFARRQEIEKRLEKPNVRKRIKMLAKRLYKDVRKKEVARKKG